MGMVHLLLVRMLGKIIGYFSTNIFRLVRFGLVSGTVLVIVLYLIDSYTKSEYGVSNLYLIAGALSFFPLLFGSFFEIYFWLIRREKKRIKKKNMSYVNDSAKRELISRYNKRH